MSETAESIAAKFNQLTVCGKIYPLNNGLFKTTNERRGGGFEPYGRNYIVFFLFFCSSPIAFL